MPKLNKGVELGWLAVKRGMDTKAAAITYGCSRSILERKAREAGMCRKLVTPSEFDRVLIDRLAGGAGVTWPRFALNDATPERIGAIVRRNLTDAPLATALRSRNGR